jgi:hypothetical protein
MTIVSVIGAAAASLFGSSSSLRKGEKDRIIYQGRQQEDKYMKTNR